MREVLDSLSLMMGLCKSRASPPLVVDLKTLVSIRVSPPQCYNYPGGGSLRRSLPSSKRETQNGASERERDTSGALYKYDHAW